LLGEDTRDDGSLAGGFRPQPTVSTSIPTKRILILTNFQVETNYPRPCSETPETDGVGCQARETCLQLGKDSFHGIKDPVGELLFPQLIPDMLLRIELWRITGQSVESDILRDTEILGRVGTCPIQDHDDEFVRMRFADLIRKLIHPFGIHLRADFPVELSLLRTHRPIDIHELPFVTVGDLRAQRRRCPTTSNTHHPTKPGFVLKHEPDRTFLNRFGLQQDRHLAREFFFHSSWILGSLFG